MPISRSDALPGKWRGHSLNSFRTSFESGNPVGTFEVPFGLPHGAVSRAAGQKAFPFVPPACRLWTLHDLAS
jgi:hypothetical protein